MVANLVDMLASKGIMQFSQLCPVDILNEMLELLDLIKSEIMSMLV